MALEGRYERDAEFRAEHLTRYLSLELRQRLNVTKWKAAVWSVP